MKFAVYFVVLTVAAVILEIIIVAGVDKKGGSCLPLLGAVGPPRIGADAMLGSPLF